MTPTREDTVTRIAQAIIDSGEEPWQAQAACQGLPELVDATRPPEVWDGLALCAHCPVITQCRQWAQTETDYVGIAGGRVWTTKHRGRQSTLYDASQTA